jgi:hypothetical protein
LVVVWVTFSSGFCRRLGILDGGETSPHQGCGLPKQSATDLSVKVMSVKVMVRVLFRQACGAADKKSPFDQKGIFIARVKMGSS